MIDALLNLIPGGSLTAILAAVFAGIAAVGTLLYKTKQAGENQQKAKEAEARERNLDAIKRAADARPVGGVQSDPRNRDNS